MGSDTDPIQTHYRPILSVFGERYGTSDLPLEFKQSTCTSKPSSSCSSSGGPCESSGFLVARPPCVSRLSRLPSVVVTRNCHHRLDAERHPHRHGGRRRRRWRGGDGHRGTRCAGEEKSHRVPRPHRRGGQRAVPPQAS